MTKMLKGHMSHACRDANHYLPRLKGKAVTVVGLGRSGASAVRLLQAGGARVTIADHRQESELAETLAQLDAQNLHVCVGSEFETAFSAPDLVVVSPGVPSDLDCLDAVRTRGISVVSEIECASWFFSQPIVAVTGTNGKSTTVSLIARMLEENGHRIFVGGNLGVPLSDAAWTIFQHCEQEIDSASSFDWIVAEVSSFQLETIERFHPTIAVLLNFSPDHLDRHSSLDAYQSAKSRIFENQSVDDYAVVNADDPFIKIWKKSIHAHVLEFSVVNEVDAGASVKDGRIIARLPGGGTVDILSCQDIGLRGSHNLANILAAITVCLVCGASVEAIRSAVRAFSGIDHALEPVREHRGVLFINDSKGTNIDATIKAVESFDQPLVIILGGIHKGGDFTRLRTSFQDRVKHAIILGDAASLIVQALQGVVRLSQVTNLSEAVSKAVQVSAPGDVVLLSPACASFDSFRDYQDRGQQFRDLVNRLPSTEPQ